MKTSSTSGDAVATVRFKPTVVSLYFGFIAVLFGLHAYRVTVNSSWTYDLALAAALADLAVLVLFICLFLIGQHLTRRSPGFALINRAVHSVLLTLGLLVAWVSQLLLIRTGESLDFSIILFTINHLADLMRVLGGEVNSDAFVLFLLCLVPLLLISLKGGSRSISVLRNLALLTPVITLPACSIMDDDVDSLQTVVHVSPGQQQGLYRGIYADWKHHELSWGQKTLTGWRLGIFAGLLVGDSLGKSEYLALSKTAGTADLYSDVQYAGRSGSKSPNIVLIILESFRHTAVDAYLPEEQRDKEPNTPFLNSLAMKGVMVERTYTTIPHTSKALVGIYCGTFPRFNSAISEAAPGGMPLRCMPHLLSEAGYSTAHFQTASGEFEDRVGLLGNVGFEHFVTEKDLNADKWGRAGYLGLEDRALITPIVEWMKQKKVEERPYFASILTLATHHPYEFPGNEGGIGSTDEAYQSYMRGVRYTDTVLEELFDAMAANGLINNTIFVLTGDHGEAFGEHGQILHNGVSYEEGQRVPLIIYAPDYLTPGARIGGLRQHVDLMPTLLSLASVDYKGTLPGLDIINSDGHDEIITSCFYTDYCLNYYRADGYKLSYFYGKREPVLYYLPADPHEQQNLANNQATTPLNLLTQAVAMRKGYETVYNNQAASGYRADLKINGALSVDGNE